MARASAKSLLALLFCSLTSCTWMDHHTNAGLKRELMERSKGGLSLVNFSGQQDLVILSFDGQSRTVHRSCCPSAQGFTVRGDRIAFQDLSETFNPNPRGDPNGMLERMRDGMLELSRAGASVVETDAKGVVVARSVVRFTPSLAVYLATDGEHFAITGPPVDHRDWGEGLYVGGFHESSARKLVGFKYARDYPIVADYPTADWSPRCDTLLFSNQGTVMEVDVATGRSRKLADGGAARWSPNADWISYITRKKSEIVLLNPSTGESKRIDPGREMWHAPKWSPDGKYLLVTEGDGGYILGASLWVYRMSDGVWVYLDVGTERTEWHWMETGV